MHIHLELLCGNPFGRPVLTNEQIFHKYKGSGWLVGWLDTMTLSASLLVLLLGPMLVRFFRITGQILARKRDNLGEQISTNAHNRHCTQDMQKIWPEMLPTDPEE